MHPNEELARRELEALEAGDRDTLAQMYAADFVLHYPGRNPLSGDHRTLGAFLGKVRSSWARMARTRESSTMRSGATITPCSCSR